MDSTGFHFSDAFVEKFSSKSFRDDYVADQTAARVAMLIRSLREERGWSQAELAKRMGTKQSAVSRMEDPDYGRLAVQTLLQAASAFDLPLFIDMPEWPNWFDQLRALSDKGFERNGFSADALKGKPETPTQTTSTSSNEQSIHFAVAGAAEAWGEVAVYQRGQKTYAIRAA